MSADKRTKLDRNTALNLAERLELIYGYPRGAVAREASADQLQIMFTSREQAATFIEVVIGAMPEWSGWPAMKAFTKWRAAARPSNDSAEGEPIQ